MSFVLNSYFAPLGSGFILQIDTTKEGSTSSNQFNLALRPSTFYHFYVDWGDGSPLEEYNFSNTTTGVTHTYPSEGVYNVSVGERSIGGFPAVRYADTEDKLKILKISEFGTNQFGTNWANAFDGCLNLNIDALDFATAKTQRVDNFLRAFAFCSSLSSFPLIDTSSGTNFQAMFRNCVSLSSFPLIDTSKGTNFINTWLGAVNLKEFPQIDTSSGTNFQGAWFGCISLSSFPLIDTSSGTNFQSTWQECISLSSFPLIDTSSGTNFQSTWQECISLSSFPLIDTSSGTNFTFTWLSAVNLKEFPQIDTSSFNQRGKNVYPFLLFL
jgi:hypothetical protein